MAMGDFPESWYLMLEIIENDWVKLTVEATVAAPVEKAWRYWSEPEHIVQWCFASDDWHAPRAENDLRTGGSFSTRMEAKDGSFGFEFGGQYSEVKPFETIAYMMGDGRSVLVRFVDLGDKTQVIETFDAEKQNAPEMQQAGWQAIMNNYKKHVEQTD